MTDQTKIAEELAEPHHFGSHNIYMPTAPVGHFLPYYPWHTLYEQLPFEGAYPQLLYTNSQQMPSLTLSRYALPSWWQTKTFTWRCRCSTLWAYL
ncbi:hypothetical protein [Porphyromonas uenonis]|uniref:hypothetical protein n=1 Tax=Porphyromonas uenonis TaxID=281920 RepID=UPI001EE2FEE0|nr:hypothetical protein [Porphyromonas uenonis]